MKSGVDIRRLNPVEISQVEHSMADPVFDELRQAIVEIPRDRNGEVNDPSTHLGSTVRPIRRVSIAVTGVAAAVVLVVGLLTLGGSGSNGQVTVPSQAGRALGGSSHGSAASLHTGTWQILDASVKGVWQQNVSGPPGAYLACPSASICYQMSGQSPSALAGAPLLSESLYFSNDAGATWTAYPMPSGFAPTSPISCGGPKSCAAGGTYGGGSVLVSTQDGGHSFSISPVPQNVGSFVTIDCTAINVCSGLAANRLYVAGHSDATFLSTADGGTTFTDTPIIPCESMESLSCASPLDCTAVGTSDAMGVNDLTAGVVATTSDGGHTWVPGSLPVGFGISQGSEISCGDAHHCSVSGNISIAIPNPPQCSSLPPAANKSATSGGGFSCNPNGLTTSGDIASTVDGGRTWTPDPLPSEIAQPNFTSISCPTARECWAAGSAAAAIQAGTSHIEGGPILLGTTNGGSSWSPVRFTVPRNAPNYDGQSYLSIGFITCPSVHTCIANGATAQGSPTAPIYTLTQNGPRY